MDHSRFDDLTRRLAAGATRRAGLRAALGGLLTVGLGPAMAATMPADVEAKKRRRKKRSTIACTPNSAEKPCPSGMICVGLDPDRPNEGRCMCNATGVLQSPCGATCCPAGATCTSSGADRTCRCDNGYPPCAGRCCAAGEACSFGTCVACPSGQTPCGSACCFSYQTCQSGVCVGCANGPSAPCAIAANCCYGSQSRCLNNRCCAPLGSRCVYNSSCCSGDCDRQSGFQDGRCTGVDPAITPAEISAAPDGHAG